MVPKRALRSGLCAFLVVSLAGALVVAVSPGVAAPPPRPLCDACGDSFEATAEAHGVVLTVEESTATISVRENGTATWVVGNHLGNSAGAERVRSNASLRAEIAERAMWHAEFLGANVSAEGVLTLRYRTADFASRSVGGALYSGEFTEGYGYRNLDGLGADRLAVVAPDGMQVGWTVSDGAVSEDGRRMTLTQLDDEGFVTFVPRDAALGPLWSLLAVGSLVAPVIVTNALVAVALPTAAFALLFGVAIVAFPRSGPITERVRNAPARVLTVGGTLIAVTMVAAGGLSLLGGASAPLFGIAIAFAAFGVALSRPAIRERASYRTLVAGAVAGTLLAAGSTVAAAIAFEQNGITYSLLSSLPFLAPVFALLPAGYAVGRKNRRLALGIAAVGFALALVLRTSFVSPTGVRPVLVVFAVAYAVGITVVGAPLLVVGMSLAGDRPGTKRFS
jgi:hypothetical protein